MKLIHLNRSIINEDEVIKKCLDFLASKGGSTIANGKHLVEEEGIFVNVSEYNTRPFESGKWEAHKEYVDFQIVLEGAELIHVSNISNMEIGEYHPDRDFLQCYGKEEDSYVLDESKGILLFPEDAHKPCINVDNIPAPIKKAVFKIPVKLFT